MSKSEIRKTISSNNSDEFVNLVNEYFNRGYVPVEENFEEYLNEQLRQGNNDFSIVLKVDEYFGYISTFINDPMEICDVGNMKDGKKHGQWLTTWVDTLRLWSMREYNNGSREGDWVEYDTEGGWKFEEGKYQDDKKNGVWTQYFENGNIHIERHYEKGIPYSISIYYENGQLKQEGYFRGSGIKYGKWVNYEDDGTLFSENFYKWNGELVDTRISKNGILISINKDDIKPKNGLHIEEYKYSKDYLYKGYYENGIKIGKWKCYKEPEMVGDLKLESPTLEHEYENGKIIRTFGMMIFTQDDHKKREEWNKNIVTKNINNTETFKSYTQKQFIKKMEDFENLINGLINLDDHDWYLTPL